MKGKGLVREQTGRVVIGLAEHSGSHPFGLEGLAPGIRRGRSGGSQRTALARSFRSTVAVGEAGGTELGASKRLFFSRCDPRMVRLTPGLSWLLKIWKRY